MSHQHFHIGETLIRDQTHKIKYHLVPRKLFRPSLNTVLKDLAQKSSALLSS